MTDALIDLIRSTPTGVGVSDATISGLHSKLTEALTKGGKKVANLVDRGMTEGLFVPAQGHALACTELLAHRAIHGGALTLEFVELARVTLLNLTPREALQAAKAVTQVSRQMTKLLIPTTHHVRGIAPLKHVINAIAGQHRATTTTRTSSVMAEAIELLLNDPPSCCVCGCRCVSWCGDWRARGLASSDPEGTRV